MNRVMPMAALLSLLFATAFAGVAQAQQGEQPAPETAEAAEEDTGGEIFRSRALPDTVMFTIDELNEIQGRIAGGAAASGTQNQSSVDERTTLYLSAIMYFAPDDWRIWVNGNQVSPDSDLQLFEVVSITPEYVELIVPLSAMGMRPVRVEPNQTFIPRQGVVVEGRWMGEG